MDDQAIHSAATQTDGPVNGNSRKWRSTENRKIHLVGVPMSTKMIDGLERFRSSLDDEVSRPQAVRMILAEFLKAKQFG